MSEIEHNDALTPGELIKDIVKLACQDPTEFRKTYPYDGIADKQTCFVASALVGLYMDNHGMEIISKYVPLDDFGFAIQSVEGSAVLFRYFAQKDHDITLLSDKGNSYTAFSVVVDKESRPHSTAVLLDNSNESFLPITIAVPEETKTNEREVRVYTHDFQSEYITCKIEEIKDEYYEINGQQTIVMEPHALIQVMIHSRVSQLSFNSNQDISVQICDDYNNKFQQCRRKEIVFSATEFTDYLENDQAKLNCTIRNLSDKEVTVEISSVPLFNLNKYETIEQYEKEAKVSVKFRTENLSTEPLCLWGEIGNLSPTSSTMPEIVLLKITKSGVESVETTVNLIDKDEIIAFEACFVDTETEKHNSDDGVYLLSVVMKDNASHNVKISLKKYEDSAPDTFMDHGVAKHGAVWVTNISNIIGVPYAKHIGIAYTDYGSYPSIIPQKAPLSQMPKIEVGTRFTIVQSILYLTQAEVDTYKVQMLEAMNDYLADELTKSKRDELEQAKVSTFLTILGLVPLPALSVTAAIASLCVTWCPIIFRDEYNDSHNITELDKLIQDIKKNQAYNGRTYMTVCGLKITQKCTYSWSVRFQNYGANPAYFFVPIETEYVVEEWDEKEMFGHVSCHNGHWLTNGFSSDDKACFIPQ